MNVVSNDDEISIWEKANLSCQPLLESLMGCCNAIAQPFYGPGISTNLVNAKSIISLMGV